MARHTYVLADAFTREKLAGNPCAVVLDADALDAGTMQRIAREMNLSETAFVVSSRRADIGVRYFTPVHEMPLAGHPTIATAHVLREAGRLHDGTSTFEMPAGIVPVECGEIDGSPGYTMTQPAPAFLRSYDRAAIAAGLSLNPADLDPTLEPRTVSTGAPMLMVALASRAALDRASPDRAALFADPQRDFISVHVFVRDDDRPYAFLARHFSPPGDVPEDPVTGSACGAMAAYAWSRAVVERRAFVVRQGLHVGRPGDVYVDLLGARDAIAGVRVGGHAVTVARGELLL
ncbi:MAG TPA: PhzF family phenazine biosynthesis protein [Candidatus Baltobacteraceae bacterium]